MIRTGNVDVRRYRTSDAAAAAEVISATFDEFNRSEGTAEAVARYLRTHDPNQGREVLRRYFARTPTFFVAVHRRRIVGLIRGRGRRLVNLFVARDYHRRGIGRALLRVFEVELSRRGQRAVVVRSSLFAAAFYRAHGYRRTAGVRDLFGLAFVPMRKTLTRVSRAAAGGSSGGFSGCARNRAEWSCA